MNIDRDSRDYPGKIAPNTPSRSTSWCIRTSIADERVRTASGESECLGGRGSATTARGRQSLNAARYRHDSGDQAADQAARLDRPRHLADGGRSNLGLTSTLSVPCSPASSMPSQRRAIAQPIGDQFPHVFALCASPLHFLICLKEIALHMHPRTGTKCPAKVGNSIP